jgi:hypothetical protein
VPTDPNLCVVKIRVWRLDDPAPEETCGLSPKAQAVWRKGHRPRGMPGRLARKTAHAPIYRDRAPLNALGAAHAAG